MSSDPMAADLQAQLAEALAGHELRTDCGVWFCSCGLLIPNSDTILLSDIAAAHRAHVSEVLTALVSAHVAQVREGLADAWDAGWLVGNEYGEEVAVGSGESHHYAQSTNPHRPSVAPREQGNGGGA